MHASTKGERLSPSALQTSRSHEDLRRLSVCAALTQRPSASQQVAARQWERSFALWRYVEQDFAQAIVYRQQIADEEHIFDCLASAAVVWLFLARYTEDCQ